MDTMDRTFGNFLNEDGDLFTGLLYEISASSNLIEDNIFIEKLDSGNWKLWVENDNDIFSDDYVELERYAIEQAYDIGLIVKKFKFPVWNGKFQKDLSS